MNMKNKTIEYDTIKIKGWLAIIFYVVMNAIFCFDMMTNPKHMMLDLILTGLFTGWVFYYHLRIVEQD